MADPASPIYLGNYLDTATGKPGAPLTYDGERHIVLFGPNGSGKSTRMLVPNLLQIRGRSVIVIDPKGELTAITRAQRERFGKVVVLNPYDALGLGNTCFNPLGGLDPDSDTFFDDAKGIAEALITIDQKDPHWSESAQGLVIGLIMWEVCLARQFKRDPSLENVRFMLTDPDRWEGTGDNKRLVGGLRHTAGMMVKRGSPEIASLAGRFQHSNDEIASIQSTADRMTNWMLSPPMRKSMEKGDFRFADLKKEPTTVYLVLPAQRLRTQSIWLRLVIVSALQSFYTPGGVKTLFMMDEFAQLGHLGPIEDALGMARGYGIQMWPVLQDLNQLKALYEEKWPSFMANAGIIQSFAPNDHVTAEWMSERAGETTVAAAGFNQGDSQSMGGQGSMSSGISYSQSRRRLFLPQELMDMPKGTGLLWIAGKAKSVPFFAPSYRDTPLRNAASPNPFYATASKVSPAPRPKTSKPMLGGLAAAAKRAIKQNAKDVRAGLDEVADILRKRKPPAQD